MRKLILALAVVLAACGSPGPMFSPEVTDSDLIDVAEATCDAFEVLWLHEIVDVARDELGGSETEMLVAVGVMVATTCPELIDMFIEELWDQYPHLAERVADGIEAVAEEAA